MGFHTFFGQHVGHFGWFFGASGVLLRWSCQRPTISRPAGWPGGCSVLVESSEKNESSRDEAVNGNGIFTSPGLGQGRVWGWNGRLASLADRCLPGCWLGHHPAGLVARLSASADDDDGRDGIFNEPNGTARFMLCSSLLRLPSSRGPHNVRNSVCAVLSS